MWDFFRSYLKMAARNLSSGEEEEIIAQLIDYDKKDESLLRFDTFQEDVLAKDILKYISAHVNNTSDNTDRLVTDWCCIKNFSSIFDGDVAAAFNQHSKQLSNDRKMGSFKYLLIFRNTQHLSKSLRLICELINFITYIKNVRVDDIIAKKSVVYVKFTVIISRQLKSTNILPRVLSLVRDVVEATVANRRGESFIEDNISFDGMVYVPYTLHKTLVSLLKKKTKDGTYLNYEDVYCDKAWMDLHACIVKYMYDPTLTYYTVNTDGFGRHFIEPVFWPSVEE